MSATTHTYVLMPVSKRTYNEIKQKLKAAGHDQAIQQGDDGIVLDMHGIALSRE